MAREEDQDVHLPGAPPPSPTKREAAIETALRHFDAAQGRVTDEDRPVVPARSPKPGWIRAPQIGLFASVALIAVLGLPGVRRLMNESPVASHRDVRQTEATPRSSAPAAPVGDVSESAPIAAEPSAEEPAVRKEPPGDARLQADASTDDSPPPAPLAMAAPMTAPPPPPPPPAAAPPPSAARFAEGASHADRSASLAKAEASDVVVTASRRSSPGQRAAAGRGDWNACTVNDPAREITKCSIAVEGRGKGDKAIARAHVAEGISFAWRGNDDAAIAAFDQALALSPKLAAAYLNRGLLYQRQGDLDRAIADLDRAARHDPASASILYNRSLMLRQRGQKGDAGKADSDAQKALDIDPGYDAVIAP